jgi:CBS domain-containing protein
VRVSEVMTRGVAAVPIGAPLVEAARVMRDSDIGLVPVRSESRIVGMLTDRDITVRATASGLDPRSTRVEDVMTPMVASCRRDAGARLGAAGRPMSDTERVAIDPYAQTIRFIGDRDPTVTLDPSRSGS